MCDLDLSNKLRFRVHITFMDGNGRTVHFGEEISIDVVSHSVIDITVLENLMML